MQMKEFDTIQREKLKSIADYLRQERQEKAISLEEIAVKTFIPLRLLQALDTGHVDRLPEPVFVQGFIRRYADALGLDGWALAKSFPTESTPTEPEPVELTTPAPPSPTRSEASPIRPEERLESAKPAPPVPSPQRVSVPGQSFEPTPAKLFPLPGVLAVTTAVLLVGTVAIGLLNRPQPNTVGSTGSTSQEGANLPPSSAPSPSPLASSQAKLPSPEPNRVASPSPDGTAAPSQTQAPTLPGLDTPVQVAVNLKDGDSWIEVVADGKTEFQGTLKQGEQKTWTAQKKLVLIAGNAGAVYVSHNQGQEEKMGALGEVKDRTFPSEGTTTPAEKIPTQSN
ncbi:DUF4115 domain-containing protein [Kovacikia minuta CCNUW1]|uniref:helix-turn-helix domain-containing protein n=1 Tax=Kovacikia minuta TaxID=2931930 RepID=UPI001CCC5C1E|nr:RodZ domain-containing protein [Kovacikia minuta]UBF26565.1 DUF4115 domain-containing protein [Kovacikia minuta CCNUW1]